MMSTRVLLISSIAGAIAALSASASAQPSVLIAAAASSLSTDCRFVEVQSKLVATGAFSSVDIYNASSGTPNLAQLMAYDAVLTWANNQYSTAATMGDVLADYVDAGGGVVVAVFATASIPLSGRWVSGGYEVIIAGTGQTAGAAMLGTVHEPAHAIMAGVLTFDGGSSSYRPTTTNLTAGALRIADWSDGRVLVAAGANPKRVDLGFYPPSSDCRSDFWLASTDGARLMANALVYVAGGITPPCYPNCDASPTPPILNVEDFTCFINEFAAATQLPHQQQLTHYANCDQSTTAPVLNVEDFTCFINKFAQGCD
jgi:hypothetical protein